VDERFEDTIEILSPSISKISFPADTLKYFEEVLLCFEGVISYSVLIMMMMMMMIVN